MKMQIQSLKIRFDEDLQNASTINMDDRRFVKF